MKVYDCLIIGGGPSGLSAGIYSARAGLKVAFLEKEYFGGKLNKTPWIENYPGHLNISGIQLGEIMTHQIEKLNIDKFNEEVIGIKKGKKNWILKTNKRKSYYGKTILIATGMKERTLDIPNVNEYFGKGISYCAICDGNIYQGKKVIVVGGGNSAIEESIYLSKIVKKVELVHRRTEFRAEEIMVKKMKKIKNIKINTPYSPIEVIIKKQKVAGLKVKNNSTENIKIIKGEGVFFYIGLIPENYFLHSINLKLNSEGFVEVNEKMETSVEGIYAAGDITDNNFRQITTATRDGALAAISIKNYINSLK